MPVLTAAITALGLAGTPGLPGGPYDHTSVGGSRSYVGDYTRLSTNGGAGRLYGGFTRVPNTTNRSYSEDFTRLVPGAISGQPYASFTGKAEQTFLEKAAFFSIIPVVTYGEVTDVDVDVPLSIIPRVALSATVQQAVSANLTVRPVVSMARGAVNSTGTTPKSAGLSVVPVVSLSASVQYSIASSLSVIPVVTLTAAIEDAGKNASLSVIPVVNLTTAVNRVTATQSWSVPMVVRPVVSLSPAVKVSGEVDRITVNAWPKGHIRITKA